MCLVLVPLIKKAGVNSGKLEIFCEVVEIKRGKRERDVVCWAVPYFK